MGGGDRTGRQSRYVLGVVASAALIAFVIAYAFQSPQHQTEALARSEVAQGEEAAPAERPTSLPAPPRAVAESPREPVSVVTTEKSKAGLEPLSRQCLELWSNLTAARIEGWRPDVQALRTLTAPTECRSTSPKLAAAALAYQKACAPIFEGRFLDDRNGEDRNVIAACAQSATALRAWLGTLATNGKALADITDPNLLVDRLLVASGRLGGETTVPRGKLALDPASVGEVSGTSFRLLQIADTDQEKNMASRFYVTAEAQSAGLNPRDVFRNSVSSPATGRTTASQGATTADISVAGQLGTTASGASGATTDSQTQIATIRGEIETYNPGFFNRPRRGRSGP